MGEQRIRGAVDCAGNLTQLLWWQETELSDWDLNKMADVETAFIILFKQILISWLEYPYILTDHTHSKSPLAKLWLTTKQRHKQIQRRARSRMHIYVIRPRHQQHFNLLYRIRKIKDYVYGIWVHKVLGIWKCYHRVKKSLVSCMKMWTEARNNNKYMKSHCKLIYQLILRCEPKSGISCRRQVVHPRPQNVTRRISC